VPFRTRGSAQPLATLARPAGRMARPLPIDQKSRVSRMAFSKDWIILSEWEIGRGAWKKGRRPRGTQTRSKNRGRQRFLVGRTPAWPGMTALAHPQRQSRPRKRFEANIFCPAALCFCPAANPLCPVSNPLSPAALPFRPARFPCCPAALCFCPARGLKGPAAIPRCPSGNRHCLWRPD